jgi:hypothetical protein
MIPREAMTKIQTCLMDLMSKTSENHWCAGWMEGLEVSLWKDMHDIDKLPSGFWDENWGPRKDQYVDELIEIAECSAKAGGWVVRDEKLGREVFVTFSEFTNLHPELCVISDELLNVETNNKKELLAVLTNEELINVILSINLCSEHLTSIVKGDKFSTCIRCSIEEMSGVLSAIDYEICRAEGRGNEMDVSDYDTSYDPNGVIEHVRDFVRNE